MNKYPLAHSDDDPYVEPHELKEANARHDAEMRDMHISTEGRISGSWNPAKLSLRGKLTDKKIKAYTKAGFYTLEYREARKKAMEKKYRKTGNFVERDGRLIYAP